MRTTDVLDDDVLNRLQEESRIREATFRATLNEVIRDGLAVAEQRRTRATPFRVEPFPIGLKPGLSDDNISQLIALAEGEDAR